MTFKASGPGSVLATIMALSLLLGTSLDQVRAVGSFQNGRLNGHIYAGGVDYSSNNIFITGITYSTNGDAPSVEPRCLVSRIPSAEIDDHSKAFSRPFGNGNSMVGCRSISVLHDPSKPWIGEKRPFVVGGTLDGGADLPGQKVPTPSGVVMTFKEPKEQDGKRTPIDYSNVALIDNHEGGSFGVSYPVSIRYVFGQDSDGNGDKLNEAMDKIVYIASLNAFDSVKNPSLPELMVASHNQPNWIKYYKTGSSFEFCLQKFDVPKGTDHMENRWITCHPATENDGDVKSDVYVGGMILKRDENTDYLIVAGSTTGSGEIYGDSEPGRTDEDGFIAVFDGHTGQLRTVYNNNARNVARPSTPGTDLILGICDDPNDNGHFYIVGSTTAPIQMGTKLRRHGVVIGSEPGSMHGFVQKISMYTLEPVWGRTWSAKKVEPEKSTTAGYGCKVIQDGSLYVVGVAERGANVVRGMENQHEFDDIVAMRLTGEGDEVWVKQFGSKDGNEGLAQSDPVSIDHDENLVIFGETKGSLFRKREELADDGSDIFLATLSKEDGSHDKVFSVHKHDLPPDPMLDLENDIKEEFEQHTSGILSGGKWEDHEVYGTNDWIHREGLGIQSGPTSGSVYAGGMVYDVTEDTVYATGIAYDSAESDNIVSSCMATRLPLGKEGFHGWSSATGKLIGDDALDVCESIALHGDGEVVVVGNAGAGSDLQGRQSNPLAGFALAMDKFDLEEADATTLLSERPNHNFLYPTSIVSDGDDMYIVSLRSTDNKKTPEAERLEEDGHSGYAPNWINMEKYGSSFDMSVSKLTLSEKKVDGVSLDKISFETRWEHTFPIIPNENGNISRVFLGGAILKKDLGYLAIAGSTRGMGEGYGMAKGDDEDGFVTLVDMDTGMLAGTVLKDNMREGTPEDDSVLGICDDPNDSTSFYIVGSTKGMMSGTSTTEITPGSTQAFLVKVDAVTLDTIWKVQLGARRHKKKSEHPSPTTAKAVDCAVSGDSVYVGGIVDDGAGMVAHHMPRSSRGGDDIWLSSISTNNGEIKWVRQMGSEGNDHIAPRGGLAINRKGNVLVFGDTNGEFYRNHDESDRNVNELFLMEVGTDGSHKPHVQHKDAAPPVGKPPKRKPQSTPPPFLIEPEKNGVSKALVISLSVLGSLLVLAILVYVKFSGRRETDAKVAARDGIINTSKVPPPSSFKDSREIDGDAAALPDFI